jgi:hypothetical protein
MIAHIEQFARDAHEHDRQTAHTDRACETHHMNATSPLTMRKQIKIKLSAGGE